MDWSTGSISWYVWILGPGPKIFPSLRGHEHDRSSEARGQSTGSWCGSHLRPGWWRRWPHRRDMAIGNCCIFQNGSLKIKNESAEILLSKCCPNSSNPPFETSNYIYIYIYIILYPLAISRPPCYRKGPWPTIAQVTLPRPFCCPR